METQSKQSEQAWSEVVTPLLNGETNRENAEKLSTMLEFLSAKDHETWIQEQIVSMEEQVRNVYIPADQIEQQWNELLPILPVVEDQSLVSQTDTLMDQLVIRDHVQNRQEILKALKEMKERESFQLDALVWTAIVIGGTIILTLFYVAVRRWLASKKTQSQKSENS
ncbi:hypothetical protein H0266_03155 [Halobacillus locisalis]|uniref:Sporulation protein YpjB n=1 Tax=Halobacillus locisalis TaxID=220753 RepID=A0A838CPM4_9BACI|nr:sporulation protein YpjB [Halobacillus locisalis]MBA2173891.1 hypothetical protein [Halobacillus locisalis]